jgi:hypothetical protein
VLCVAEGGCVLGCDGCVTVRISRRFDSTVVPFAFTFGAKLSKKSNLVTRQGALCMCGEQVRAAGMGRVELG